MSAQIHAIAVPKWGIEMVEGTLKAWNKEVGDEVSKGEEILELESEKIVNMLEAGGEGVLRRQLAEPGLTLQVGELLGIIADASVPSQGACKVPNRRLRTFISASICRSKVCNPLAQASTKNRANSAFRSTI